MALPDTEGSTVPNTPESSLDASILIDDDAFALLRPISPSAQDAFDASMNDIIIKRGEDPAFEHCHQFVHAEQVTKRASSVFTEDDGASFEDPNVDAASRQWNGVFKFSLRKPPRDERSGWYLGTGRGRSQSLDQVVDILLASSANAWAQRGLAGTHARLYFHTESHRMVLQARHSMTVGKSERKIRDSQCQVLDDQDLIVIGDFVYAFEYTSHFRSLKFEAELSHYVQRACGPQWAINKLLSPASVGAPISLGEYYRSPSAFAQGTFGQVAAGWARDGSAVAIKCFKNPKRSSIESHNELMRIIGSHDNVLRLLDCIKNFEAQVPAAQCVYSPLAAMTLRDVISSYETNPAAQLTLVKDYLAGLSHLHEKGIMHRDIKPDNLAIRSIQDPIGVILDLDAATTSQTSTDHMQGTIPYLAPEIIALKDWKPQHDQAPPPYEKSVDIWALGLSIFALLTRRHWSWKRFPLYDNDKSDKFSSAKYGLFIHQVERLEKSVEGPISAILAKLLHNMTAQLPKNRPRASELLQSARSAGRSTNVEISITPKQAGKHKLLDEGDMGSAKRQHIR